ncbi:precorrin-3B synthase [Trinickia violacea]|uniref:Precorrin-3B synthase n=1 Tax=Trinickia violacea TaxID=2571746 RepID=A0A4P8ITD3_9BURK|nr:precorrin-3B synthase [Trinickia violacea]QCP52372.1 precorrin-3B synthase [Trinickia violacea]
MPAVTTSTAPRPTACPGLARIVAALDGGICRIKLPCGELSAEQACALADAAGRYASGVVDVTNRANLQLRGVRSGDESALTQALIDAGLGPDGRSDASGSTDQTAQSSQSATSLAADDVRNVMVSPAAGRDPQASIDTTPLAHDILERLRTDTRLHALSAKFALLLDGGERLAMLDHPHDIWLAAMPSAHAEAPLFAFGLAGCPPVAGDGAASCDVTRATLAAVEPQHAGMLVAALLHTFLDLAEPDMTRMRDLLGVRSVDELMRHVESRIDFPLVCHESIRAWRRAPADASLRLGAHRQRTDDLYHVGGQAPLGRLNAASLRGLAALARELGNATLRMTPWQSVLLPDVPSRHVTAAIDALSALGLACRSGDPLTRLIACTGSTGCAKGLADTKADAMQLALRLPAGVDVHLSGCPRSCAAAHCAPHTLLAVAPGRYDLYQRDALPLQSGFGCCVARHMTIDEAAAHLSRQPWSPIDA